MGAEETMAQTISHDGWLVRESGPHDGERAVLMLPGALASAAFYDDIVIELQRVAPQTRCVATTLPGYGGTPWPGPATFEERARQAANMAAVYGCDVVVGHSVGANVALEMVASGGFAGPVVLLSPSFSRRDESVVPRALDRLSSVFGRLPYSLVLRFIGTLMKGSLPPERSDAIVAELRRNDARYVQREMRVYLDYLDRHGSVAERLCMTGERAWVVFGEHDDVGLAPDERRLLEACPSVQLITVPGASHFTLIEKADQIVQMIVEASERRPRQT